MDERTAKRDLVLAPGEYAYMQDVTKGVIKTYTGPTVINPLVVEGQVHGGLAQGIGQALAEAAVYDGESGQLLSASLLDYVVPRADDLPGFVTETDESQPCTHNPLGAKGCGESGAIGAPPAVINAVVDALSHLGVTDVQMPATPERVWRAIEEARQ